ncbi:MAG: class I SAM-dependent methyltransferase [Candidatus Roizmanbacteria bacterium]|nr:class I SAM-dependent methyltransferase [Candidatus Roizmanbacteria bacterium]
MQCKKDGLVRSNPIMDTRILESLYNKSEFTYTGELEQLTTTYLHEVLPVLSTRTKASILEIGCGNGFMLSALRKKGFKQVFGIEPSRNAIAKAEPKIRNNITRGLLKRDTFPEKFFDYILCFQTLDHIPDPNTFLSICHSLLKENGMIIFFLHNVQSVSARLLKEKSPIIDIEHTFLYSPSTLTTLVKKNKFSVISLHKPFNYVSLRHILHLAPLPKSFKKYVLLHRSRPLQAVLKVSLWLPLGNICIIAQKHA